MPGFQPQAIAARGDDPSRCGAARAALRCCCAALAALALAGCGTALRIAYNQGDVAVRLVAHEYFDLRGEQSELFKAQLAAFHAWHRVEELPKYAALLEAMAARLERGLARADVQWATAAVRARMRSLTEQAVADAAPVLERLDATNLAALEKKLAANGEKFAREYLSADEQRNQRNRARRIAERFADWLGELDEEQEALIAAYVRASPRVTAALFADRLRRERELVELMRVHRGSPEIAPRLRAFLVDWEAHRAPEHARLAREQEERFVELVLALDRTLSARQRRHAVDRLRLYARELSILAAQGREPPRGSQRAELPWGIAR